MVKSRKFESIMSMIGFCIGARVESPSYSIKSHRQGVAHTFPQVCEYIDTINILKVTFICLNKVLALSLSR